MKNTTKYITYLFCLTVMISLGFTSCEDGEDGIDGIDGIEGEDGLDFGLGLEVLAFVDDITDEEAAEKIVRDFGRNTRILVIRNTTNLTEIAIPNESQLLRLIIEGNEQLERVSLPNITSVFEEVTIQSNKKLVSLTMENVKYFNGETNVQQNDVLTSLDLPSIETVNDFDVIDNPVLKKLSLANLKKIRRDLVVEDNEVLTDIDLSLLSVVEGNLILVSNDQLDAIKLNTLTNVSERLVIRIGKIKDLVIPKLAESGGVTIGFSLLESFSVPELETFDELNINSDVLLTKIDISSVRDFNLLDLRSNGSVSTETIDQIVNTLVSKNPPIEGATIRIYGLASEQAIVNTNILIDNGNTVSIQEKPSNDD